MAVKLTKGGNVNLSKEAPALKRAIIALGWQPKRTDGGFQWDLDASVFCLNENGKVSSDRDLVCYGKYEDPATKVVIDMLKHPSGSIVHSGDERTGGKPGDDETVTIDLAAVPAYIKKIVFVVTIDEAEKRGQTFGQVEGAFARLVDADSSNELARYDLQMDYDRQTAVTAVELLRDTAGDWRFRAVGEGFNKGLEAYCHEFGVSVS